MCIPGPVLNVWVDVLSETYTETGSSVSADMGLNLRLVVQGTASGDTGLSLRYACPHPLPCISPILIY
jgi:hypothetical protein